MPDPGWRTRAHRSEYFLNPAWCRRDGDGWLIAIHAQPGAKRTETAGMHGEVLKIRLAAPPVEGKANQVLLRYIAERLGLRLAEVQLVRGETSRHKTVRVPKSADPQALLDR